MRYTFQVRYIEVHFSNVVRFHWFSLESSRGNLPLPRFGVPLVWGSPKGPFQGPLPRVGVTPGAPRVTPGVGYPRDPFQGPLPWVGVIPQGPQGWGHSLATKVDTERERDRLVHNTFI